MGYRLSIEFCLQACEDDCLVPVYTEIHDVCTDLQLESVLFQIPPTDAQEYYCARNADCNYCLPMLEVSDSVLAFIPLYSTHS